MVNRSVASIVVVGAGPVGMTAALGLARRGVPVTVLESGDDLSDESRASTFHPPSLQILRDLGVVDELLQIGLKAPCFQYRGHNREIIAHLDMSVLAQDTDFPFRLQCEQSKLTRIIRRHLEAMPHVTLRFGAKVERVEVGTNRAYVFLPGDGFDPSYTADWVLGADGANSSVRRSLGIAFEGVTYPERFLVASTTHEFRDDIPDLALVSYLHDPDDWGVLLRTPSHWRALFPIDPRQPDQEALEPHHVQARLQRLVPIDEPYHVIHSTIYAVHQRVAATFALSRVLLLGDAAHINNPLGGMGMNSGLQDAHAAVDALAYVLAGGDPARAVKTYAQVRRDAAVLDVQQNTHKNYEDMRQADTRLREARQIEMAETAADPQRTRAYLRVASMLASFETSQRRMRRALRPLHRPKPEPPGQQLSASLRDWSLPSPNGGNRPTAVHLPSTDVPPCTDELLAMTDATCRPVLAGLPDGMAVARAVARFERAGVAALEVRHPSDVAAAVQARRDLLVVAAVDASGTTAGEAASVATKLAEAGADVIAVEGTRDLDFLGALHHAAGVPLAITAAAPLPRSLDLGLAGVGLLIDRQRPTSQRVSSQTAAERYPTTTPREEQP